MVPARMKQFASMSVWSSCSGWTTEAWVGMQNSRRDSIRQYPAPAPSPRLQGKDLRFQIRIYAMPFFGGQPLPRRRLTCPASAAVRLSGPRSVSPASHTQEQPPVGFIVALLCQSRRCRSGAGWGSPRIIVHIWRPVSEHTVASAFVWITGALEKHWDEPGARAYEVTSSRAPTIPNQALAAKV